MGFFISSQQDAMTIMFFLPGELNTVRDLLATNIKQSMLFIKKSKPEIPGCVSQKLTKESSKCETIDQRRFPNVSGVFSDVLAKDPFRNGSIFYHDENELQCVQAEYFGFFALALLIRAILKPLHLLEASHFLDDEQSRFFSSRVILLYAAAFQLIIGYYTATGRVILDRPFKYIGCKSKPARAIGILKKNNEWKFENRKRNHVCHWNELHQVFVSTKPPEYFLSFFRYIASYEPHGPQSEEKIIDDAIRLLPKSRHLAHYGGWGYDDFAADLVVNERSGYGGLDLRVQAFRVFTNNLLDDIANDITQLYEMGVFEISSSANDALAWSVTTPEFEWPQFDLSFMEKKQQDICSKAICVVMQFIFGLSI